MKKVCLLILVVCSLQNFNAQDITDALRYGLSDVQGTARFRAMSGAFGALGGDLSAIGVNPASSVIFNESSAAFTLAVSGTNNDVNYGNRLVASDNSNFNLAQGGGVFVYANTNANSKWNKFSLGVNYDRTANFDDNWTANGITDTSIADYFNGFAQGLRLDEISALPGETLREAYADIGSVYGFGHQQAFLGFESFILEPDMDTDDNTSYFNNIEGGNYSQSYFLNSTGYNGKMAFNFATQYDEKISLGLNVNAHFLNYERTVFYNEIIPSQSSLVNRVGFDNSLFTTGTGVSFQLGTIVKLTNEFRVGLTYDSPTWYRINEETSQFLQTSGESLGTVIIEPNVINIYPEYRLRTPGRLSGSLAYVFGDKGLISFDYSRKDFGNTEFRPVNDAFFAFQNSEISSLLGVANSYRFGGEYRLNQLSLRAGYRIEESPYVDDTFFGDLTAYSLGLGYRFGNLSLDIAFTQAQRETNEFLYSNAPTFRQTANLDTRLTDVVLTLAFGI